MSPEKFAFGVGLVVFAGGAVGLILQRMLPDTFTTSGPRDMIGAVVGLLTLLSALTMGLLIWTAYGVYAGQNTAVQTLAAKVLQLDLALADYGPDANLERANLRKAVGQAIDDVWGDRESDKDFIAENFAAAVRGLRREEGDLASLHPSTDTQRQALTLANSIVEFNRPGATANVFRSDQSRFVSAHPDCGRMGHSSFLRLWADVSRPYHVGCCRPCRRHCGFDLGLHDP